ncbi:MULTISPECIES: substrate-binding periplasmic protein [unclassified Moraxella]|uniref:substrate-binding periplasmic protein n=1 Tax=unclassified Moraxella TaxID=2685852 RepID=UPI003AF6FC28
MFDFSSNLRYGALLIVSMILVGCNQPSQTNTQSIASSATPPQNSTSTTPASSMAQATASAITNVEAYTVAINPYYPPFEYREADGSLSGFDVDLLNAIAQKQGFSVNYQQHKILNIVDTIKDGKEDMGASSIFILPERAEVIDYSNSYFSLPLAFVGIQKEGHPTSVADIKDKTIAVQKDIIMETIVDQDFVPKGNTKVAEKSNFLALKSVLNGKSDVVLDNVITLKGLQNEHKINNLYYLPLDESKSLQLGYVVKKGNTELLNKLNAGIQAVKADGTYDKIFDKWFGPSSKYAFKNITVNNGTASAPANP